MQTLTFQNITLTPIKTDSQIWLSSADLAKALNYAQPNAVTKLYNENADEFNSSMTQVIETMTNGINNSQRKIKTRIFSLRGCHLIAMFSRTAVAKQFRQWVLDILDKEVGQPTIQKTTAQDRTPLIQACTRLSAGRMSISDVYKMVGNHFGYDDVQSIPQQQLAEATAFVYEMIIRLQPQQNPQDIDNQTETNEMWRMQGLMRHDMISVEINKIRNECYELMQKLSRLHKITDLVYDAFGQLELGSTKEQKQNAYQKAIGGHQRNLTMHGFIN